VVTAIDYFYAVAQPGGYGDLPDDEWIAFFGDVDDAVAVADETDGAQVFVVKPLSESGHWDWGTRREGAEAMMYVSETAARNCTYGGCELVRRRRGSKTWEVVS